MAIDGEVCIEYIDGKQPNPYRGLAWLIITPPDKHIAAKSEFLKLKTKQQQDLRNRFDHWLDGNNRDNYFHGWHQQEYRRCFVFKLNRHRFFGFLCHPKKDDLPFTLCVLSSHSVKDGWEADKAEKDRMNYLYSNPSVIQALKNIKISCSEENTNENGKRLDGTESRQLLITN
jgi:hypothetical protein